MNLQEGIKLTGSPAIIPDCSRDELPEFFKELGFKVGVEIGVLKGAFTEKFCKAGLKMYAIDPWRAFGGQGRTQKIQSRQDFSYEHTCGVLAPYMQDGICAIVRKTSTDALKDFKNDSLDFVYIDGDHTFPHIAEDIYEWSKKVRSGGIVSGHDYFNTIPTARNILCHVKVVVDAYTRLYHIQNWWLFGQTKIRTGSSMFEEEKKNDRYYSWMFFKP